MTEPNGIDLVLRALDTDLDDARREVDRQLDGAEATASNLDEIDARVAAIEAELDILPTDHPRGPIELPSRLITVPAPCSWDERVEQAARRLRERGVDPATVGLDDLLSVDQREQIERRYYNVDRIHTHLDRYDIVFAAAAGVTATVVDAFVIRIPRSMRWNDDWQRGSWLTSRLRALSVSSDNWLAQLAKVPYDAINGYGDVIDGLGPLTHRVHTFGHDPLVGLLLGTLDIMRGTITGVGKGGDVGVADSPLLGVHNPFAALATEVLHLLSDLPTRAGLPLPGWSIPMTMPVGNVHGQTINEVAREMYLSGYDSWHLLTMSTVPATVELTLRAYWGVRCHLDEDFRTDVDRAAALAGTDTTGENPRFRTLAFAAHGVAAAGNISKLAVYGGNPLALNYAEWLAFFRALFRWAQQTLATTTTQRLLEQDAANRAALDRRWQQLTNAEPVHQHLARERPARRAPS